MAVTTTSIGNYTGLLSYPAGTTVGELQTAVDSFLTSHGWSLWDASAGSNTKAYRALNKDGSSYKYITIIFNSSLMRCGVYETWNAGTHSGTNAANGSTAVGTAYNLTVGGELLINASVRWAFFISRIAGKFSTNDQSVFTDYCGIPVGVVEIARDNPLDTAAAAYPCWAFFYAQGSATLLYCPRLRNGATGSNADLLINSVLGGGYGGISDWTHKYQPQTLLAYVGSGSETKGRIYGLKGFKAAHLNMLDEIEVKVDADLFLKNTGTTVNHIIICATEDKTTNMPRYIIPK